MSDTIKLRAVIEDGARIPVSIEPVGKEGFLRRLLRRGAAGGAGKGFRDILVNTFGDPGIEGFDPDTTLVSARVHADGRSTVFVTPSGMPALELRRPAPDTYEFSIAGIGIWMRCGPQDGRRAIADLLTRMS